MWRKVQMVSIATLAVAVAAAYVWAQDRSASSAGLQSVPRGARIGTYDSRAVALAYYRSEAGLAEIRAVVDEARKAKAANDERAGELEQKVHRWGMRSKAQTFSNLPAGDLVQKHVGAEALRAIAQRAGVQAIVPAVEWRDDALQTVDVTDALVEHFRPDDKTRDYANQIRAKPPVEIWEAVRPEPGSAQR